MVLMIIKGLFRRYEKWNPVHPTSGAFWGMGIGVGCGVGWGPGFGPEVIGYVGAGCGVGFSVGITFVGLGVGLPANHVFKLPFNALMATRSGALDLARSTGLLGTGDVTQDGWINAGVDVSGMQKRLSSFKPEQFLDKKLDLSAMNNLVSSHAKLVSDSFDKLKSCFVHPR